MRHNADAEGMVVPDVTRVSIRIPGVQTSVRPVHFCCPYCGDTSRPRVHQHDCAKPLRDSVLTEVLVVRVRCQRCGRGCRVYPVGASREQQSSTLKSLSIALYALGFSYGEVSATLERLGWFLGKTTIYQNVQVAGEGIQSIRRAWLALYGGANPLKSPRTWSRDQRPRAVPLAISHTDEGGIELTLMIPQGGNRAQAEACVRAIARELGGEAHVAESADTTSR